MKNEEKKVTITINGMDPQQWQEEKEGRVAVIFISDPIDEDDNVLNGYTFGNGGRMVSMMKHVFKCHPNFKEIIHLAMVRQFVGDVMSDIFKRAEEHIKEEKKEE